MPNASKAKKEKDTVDEASALVAQKAEEIEVTRIESDEERESMLAPIAMVKPADLKKALASQTKNRKIIKEFIDENLKADVDYGRIHVVRNCYTEKNKPGSCETDYHYSKPALFKPGQEKIFSLFGITDELEKDEDAYVMLPDVSGLIAYKCTLYRGKSKVGEGRGATVLSDHQNKPNSAIKMAEKRARMDACLSLGFSQYFTQDIYDPDYADQREVANARAEREAVRKDQDEFGLMPKDADEPMDNKERAVLWKWFLKAGFSEEFEVVEVLNANGIEEPNSMTSGQARMMMKKLKAKGPAKKDPNQELIDAGVDPDALKMPKKAIEPAAIEIDDDLKDHVKEEFELIGFNTRGVMWFMKYVAGKPFLKDFEEFEDEQWTRAYSMIEDIHEGRTEVDPTHLTKAVEEDPRVEKKSNEDLDLVNQLFPGAERVKDAELSKETK